MAAPHHASPAQPLPFLAPLVALLFLVAATTTATAAADGVPVGNGGMMHLHFYFHEIYTAGPNGTTAAVASPPAGAGGSSFGFGSVSVVDDMLLEGADPASRLIGRAQELTDAASLSEGAIRRHPKRINASDGQNGLLRNSAVPVEDSIAVASSMVLTEPEVEGKEDLQQTSSDDNSELTQQWHP
ncbi:putative disease resistance protein [Hordeum vulgare]|nr:putative disease resistance protein [Hordeum vulgare]